MLTIDASVWIAAFETKDTFHTDSLRFLTAVTHLQLPLFGPSVVIAETACGVARRTRDSTLGQRAARHLLANPVLKIVAMDDAALHAAVAIGCQCFLRGMDAFYAATAHATHSTVISWDDDLLRRFTGMTPSTWLAAHSL
jgi:predicted nucleic acid-binding protein